MPGKLLQDPPLHHCLFSPSHSRPSPTRANIRAIRCMIVGLTGRITYTWSRPLFSGAAGASGGTSPASGYPMWHLYAPAVQVLLQRPPLPVDVVNN